MEHLHRGHVAGRSGEIMLVPKPHHFLIGEWDLTTLGSATPTLSTSHPNPWAYLTRVPIILYGPPWVPAAVENEDVVDISGIAPAYARMLRLEAPGLNPPLPLIERGPRAPRAIVTVVIDGGGWNTLREHPESWPTIRSLRRRGLTFVNATIGSAPSITGALHATFGAGVYPRVHGIPGNQMRGPDGVNVDTWKDEADPEFLEVPTVSELWDERTGNEAIVGTISYEGWHLGMIGHGAQRPGGDKDLAAIWSPEDNEFWINEEYYTLPPYLKGTDLGVLQSYEAELDPRDGLEDGTWFGHLPDDLSEPLTRPGTPAYVAYTGDKVVEMLRAEGVGRDRVTDLIWIEMKMPDYAGHAWNVINPEQGDVLLEVDRQIDRFLRTLDRVAGRGNYVFAVSADHGQQPLPDLFGGWRINNKELERDIEARFGPVVEKVTPVDIYVDAERLQDEGVDLDEIARFIGTYTLGDNIPDRAPGADLVPPGRHGDPLFAGAFTTEFFESLTPDEIAAFGKGEYPEGDLTSPSGVSR